MQAGNCAHAKAEVGVHLSAPTSSLPSPSTGFQWQRGEDEGRTAHRVWAQISLSRMAAVVMDPVWELMR